MGGNRRAVADADTNDQEGPLLFGHHLLALLSRAQLHLPAHVLPCITWPHMDLSHPITVQSHGCHDIPLRYNHMAAMIYHCGTITWLPRHTTAVQSHGCHDIQASARGPPFFQTHPHGSTRALPVFKRYGCSCIQLTSSFDMLEYNTLSIFISFSSVQTQPYGFKARVQSTWSTWLPCGAGLGPQVPD